MDFKLLLSFLKKIGKNNHKEWFDANRETYEKLRTEWIGFVQNIIDQSVIFDPELKQLEAKKCIFRINRDIRFSKIKTPYKTNFGAYISKGGKNAEAAGYYMHIEPGNCFLAGGAYSPSPALLQAIRQEIDYNFNTFNQILKHKDFVKNFGTLSGDKLQNHPKGYDKDNPAIEYLKHKSFLMYKQVDDQFLSRKTIDKDIVKVFKAMKPMISFLNEVA